MWELGFSYIGFIYLLMLFVPNIIWSRNQPAGYTPQNENKVLLVCERVGQVLVTAGALIFPAFNWSGQWPRSILLLFSFALMAVYLLYWMRYFRGEHTLRDFYGSFCGVPLPGATLPVAAFLLLAIYGQNWAMAAAVVLLGIGHIGIHVQHYKSLK